MGWNSVGDGRRTVPLVVRWERAGGEKESVAFPGGCDRSIAWLLNYCLHRSIELGYLPKDKQCWGYVVRDIAGSSSPSYHGKGGGRAIDINAPENQRGTRGEIPMKVVEVFERNGFDWGGRWSYTDPMHFEARKTRLWYYRRTREMKRLVKRQRGN